MKRYASSLLLGLASLERSGTRSAEEGNVAAAPATAEANLPEGVTTERIRSSRLTRQGSVEASAVPPSENMPQVVNEDLLRDMSESGKAPGNASEFVGYLPKLKVLPCAQGCEGKDYARAVAEFIKGYRGNGRSFKERGEMIVQSAGTTRAPS